MPGILLILFGMPSAARYVFPASFEGKIFQGLEMEDALQEIQRAVEAEFSEQRWFGGPSHMLCVELMV